MLADISSGHAGGADILFLLAAIIFGLIALIRAWRGRAVPAGALDAALPAGFCLISIAWLIL